MPRTRRAVLAGCGCAIAGAVAGCTDYTVTTEGELEGYQDRLDAKNATIEDLEATLESRNARITELEAANEDLEIRVGDKAAEIESLEADLTAAYDDIDTLETDLAAEREALADLETEYDAALGEIEDLEADIADREATIEDLEGDLDDAKAELDGLKSDIDALEAEISDLEDYAAELEADIGAKEATITDLEATIDAKTEEITTLEDTVEALQPEITIPEGDIDAAVDAALDVRAAIAHVYSSYGQGTAFHIGDNRFLTAAHVVSGTILFAIRRLRFLDVESETFTREERDEDIDARILETEGGPDTTVTFGSVHDLDEGDTVFTVGHPFNVGRWIIGIGTYQGRNDDASNFDETYVADVPNESRSSGSPIFDLDGNVVGLLTVGVPDEDKLLEAPDEPFFHFNEFPPAAGFTSIDTIQHRLDL